MGAALNSWTNGEGPVLPNQIAAGEIAGTNARLKPMRPVRADVVHRHFSSVPLFSESTKRELRLLTKIGIVEPRATGATLVTEGQTGANAFVILQGKCRVNRKGRRVGQIEAGGVVGELSLLNPAPCNATVVAETPLEVAILRRRDFLQLMEHSPSISFKLLKSLAARVQELDARTIV
ncbi:MAG: family transcriptional regulator, cyclic receptor protein [Actinomycetota bacterium]|nr:family transcriptional regulator, cyclic receptor protein [Actinomycetota bacterium]